MEKKGWYDRSTGEIVIVLDNNVTNQEKRKNAIANLLLNGKLVWKHADDVSAASDVEQGLYSPQGKMSDPATEGTDAPQTNIISDGKGKVNSSTAQAKGKKVAENQSPSGVQGGLSAADRRGLEEEVKRTAAHFPMET